jgi:hypothetical protein
MSRHLYGVHDIGAWADLVAQAGATAWCVYTEAVGCDPNDLRGGDYARPGITPIVRLNNGYGKGTGTIPTPDRYADFARRCANFVAASRGIEWVVIGNEISHYHEWPTAEPITLASYVECYRLCYDAIKRVAPGVQIAPAAPAPWNASTPDARDWIMQLPTMLNMLSSRVDWICLHAYTRGYTPDAFSTGAKMDAPYAHRYSGWETLWEYMAVIPQSFRHLPVMITETNGDGPWPANNTGWVQALYGEIARWNAQPGNQPIRAACLFRWLPEDRQWSFAHSPGAADDFTQALRKGYTWPQTETRPPATTLKAGDPVVVVASTVNVRSAPSLGADIKLRLGQGATFPVEAVYSAEGLIWVQGVSGWVAESAPDGTKLLERADGVFPAPAGDRAAIVRKLAAEHGVDERLALAVIAIESGGAGFHKGRLLMRFEPHVFKAKFDALFRQHFQMGEPAWEGGAHRYRETATGEWKSFHGNQDAEYAAQRIARQIAEDAALQAASYGAGQIMGFNHATCGYESAQAMIADFAAGEEAQIRAMFTYFRNRKDSTGRSALDYLRAGDLVNFATLYNGSGQAQHYANLIRKAAERAS